VAWLRQAAARHACLARLQGAGAQQGSRVSVQPAGCQGKEWKTARFNATEELKMMALDLLVFSPWLALIAGISILVVPRLLNYIVAVYLILIGIIGLSAQL
jgi:hypothetical protein